MAERKGFFKGAAKEVSITSPAYSVTEITANAEVIAGVKSEVMAGAFHGIDTEVLTVKEAKDLVQQFLEKKVK
ncbi:hypothetical protein EJP82_11300 [Paenibacillus anaericanus]|uniref:YqzN/YkzM domain-containing protein n=1 Tax=Paenibacillus anaericanus TaxID=170367 RepID=A0A3S1DW00_9BACL|nr:hypothetical protein [Paenibacillus anaericanus]RUT46432.1 hypothetical protein EJP82_11300 [Paenibacillus anaericanus]